MTKDEMILALNQCLRDIDLIKVNTSNPMFLFNYVYSLVYSIVETERMSKEESRTVNHIDIANEMRDYAIKDEWRDVLERTIKEIKEDEKKTTESQSTHSDSRVQSNSPDGRITDTTTLLDMRSIAYAIAMELEKKDFNGTAEIRQVLALAEEVGEFVAAFRRWAGMARRISSFTEVSDELSDVVITSFVTAAVLNIDLVEAISNKVNVIYSRGWKDPR